MNDTRNKFGRAFLKFAVAWTLPVIALAADRPPGGHIDRGGSLLELFTDAGNHQDDSALTDPTVVRSRPVVVDLGALNSLRLRQDDMVALDLFDDIEITLIIEKIEGNPIGRFVATGRIADQDGGSFVIVVEQGVLVANIRAPGIGHFQIRYIGDDVHAVREIDDSQFPECGGAIEPEFAGPADGEPRRETKSTDNGDEIDVLILYTAEARIAAGGTSAIQATILMGVVEANVAYGNSQIIPRLRLVHTEEVAYNEPSSFSTILNDLRNGNNGLGVAHTLRNQYCADVVTLVVDNGQSCGVGYTLNAGYRPPSSGDFEDWAFNVVNEGCLASNITLPHEIGHNMGCHHDRENACCSSGGTTSCLNMACAGTGNPYQSQGAYDHSYGFRYPTQWRTIMAYSAGCSSCPKIPHFSNPQVSYQGQPTGMSGGHPAGADNATSINNTRTIVAQFRQSCEVSGACCDPVGGCLQATSSVCQAGGGTYVGDNTVCLGDGNGDGIDDACPSAPATGACCGSSGSSGCIVVAQSVCTAGSGTYMGDGTSCTPSPCGAMPTGACCDPSGGCSIGTSAACGAAGGAYQGDNTVCLPGMCPAPTGACCQATGTCLPLTAPDCAAIGGVFQGAGTICSPGLCTSTRCLPVELAELTASDAAAGDWFGWSVAISGPVAVAGAYADDDAGTSSGSAYVYRHNGSAWIEEQKLTSSGGAAYDAFGQGVAISGDIIAIGAHNDGPQNLGAVFVYRDNGTAWVEQAKLIPSSGISVAGFGSHVAIDGDLIVVGAQGDDQAGPSSGAAYVFEKPPGGWVDMTEIAKLTASDAAAQDVFGISVAVSGDVIVVGARFDDDGGTSSGSAYVFEKPGSGWITTTEDAKLTASDAATFDGFGGSVAISGDVIAIGASGDDDQGSSSGSLYIFDKPAGPWATTTETLKLTASDGAAGAFLGDSVSISGDVIVAGASNDVDGAPMSGSAYVYRFNGAGYTEVAKLSALNPSADDHLGHSVSVDGGRAVIGARGDPAAGNLTGSAFLFGSLSDCDASGTLDACDIIAGLLDDLDANGIPDQCIPPLPTDLDGDGDVDAADLAILLGSWGPYAPCPPYIAADFNQDCSVDAVDLAQLLGSWGP